MSNVKNPITREVQGKIAKAQRALSDAVTLLAKAEECGLDCDERKAEVLQLTEFFDKVNQVFGSKDQTQ